MFTFTFYELESPRLLLRRSIRFGMREARKRNCGIKQLLSPALSPQFRRPSGEKTHLEKAVKFLRMPSQAPTIRTQKGAFGPTRKKGGGSLPPTHSQFCLLTSLLISQTRMANGKTDLLFAICLGPGPGDKILNYMGCAGTLVTVPNWVTQKFSSLPTLLKDACPQQMERR